MKKSLCMVVAMFILCMLQVPLWGQNLTVSQIQQDIKTNGAQWEAGETSMTKLSPEERKMRLGLVPLDLTGKESKRLLLTASPVAIPPTLDWRNNGGNYVTSVKNQGQCGSCWAFGTTATLESAILLHRQTPNVDLDLSEQVMISCGGFGNCNGGDPVVTSDYFVTTGLPPESCYPYTATYGNCAVACANWQAKAEKASDWWFAGADASHAGGTTVDAIKAALYTYGPLASAFVVYEDFYSYRGGVYRHVSGSLVGGHEISIIGYDDVNQCFIAKNSWGTGWGEAGFFRIAYSEMTSGTGFGEFTMGYYIAPSGCSYTATLDQGGPYYLFPGSGAKGTVTVKADSGCAWTTLSVFPWATITSGASGTGNGTVSFSLNDYPTGAARMGGLVVAGQNVFFQQQSQTPCAFAPWPAQTSVGAAGGNQSLPVTFTSGQNCPWFSVSFGTWVTITSGQSGTGNGTVGYSVAPNTGPYSRTLSLQAVMYTGNSSAYTTILQAGANGCIHSISSANPSFTASGGTGSSNVTTGSGCTWVATSNNSWITVTGGSSGSGNGTVNYSVGANTGAADRFGTITIAGQTLTVYQRAGAACTYAISPTSQSLGASSGTGSVSVTTGSGCTWQASSGASWITVTGGSSGSGNGTVNYSVAANTGTDRSGTLTIAGQTFTVTQAAGSPTCTYAISPTINSLSASAGTGSVSVTAGTGCAWTAVSNASWITVTSGGSGSGNGSVGYSVTANTTTTSRTGTLTIAGQTFTVNQSGATCTYAISPTSQSLGASSGTGSVSVTAGSGCAWTAASNATSWLTVTGGASGSGNGTVGYAVTANTTTTSRSGTLTIAGQTFTVSQAGQACTYSISPASNSFSAGAGTGSVSVACSGSSCSWTAVSNATSWLSVTSGASGSGNGTVGYAVTANATTTSRNGTLTIGGQTFSVTQAAQSCTYSISPTSNSFAAAAGTGTVSVTAGSGCAWTATSNATSFLNVTSGASGSGNGTVGYSVAANSGTTTRNGTITVAGQTFTVNQAGQTCTYALNPTSKSFTSSTGTGTVNVTSASGCAWSATSNNTSWLTVTSGGSGSGNGTVSYSVIANTSNTSRTGTMTIGGQTHTVTQAGGTTCTYSISPTSNSFTSAGGTGSVNVTAGSGCTWQATSNASWILINYGPSGSGNGTVGYLVAANTNTSSRNGTITIGGQTHTVSQTGQSCSYSISPSSNSFAAAAGTGTVSVTTSSGCAWTAMSNATSFLSVTSGASGSGNGTVSYSVAANSGTTTRNGTITIAGQTFTVNQAGQTCTYALNPTSKSFTSSTGTGTVNVTSASGCAWTATSNATSWLTVTSGSSGSGNGTVSYSVLANTTTTSRTGNLTVGGQTFTVTQAGGTVCTYTLSPTSKSFTSASGAGSVSVTASSGCAWAATSNNTGWLTVTSGGNGSGNGTVNYSVIANTSTTSRTGTLTIGGQTHTVAQAGGTTCTYSISPASNSLSAAAGTGSVGVTAGSGCAWTAISNNTSWLTVTSGSSGSSNGTVGYSVTANTTTASRTGTLTIAGQTHTVTQAGSALVCKAYVWPVEYTFDASGTMRSIGVSADNTCKWTVTSNTPWIIAGGSGQGNGTFYLMVQGNSGPARTGTFSVNGTVVTITEKGAPK